jgi:hypothetical protein
MDGNLFKAMLQPMHHHFGGNFALLAAWATMGEGDLNMCRRGVTRIIMTP